MRCLTFSFAYVANVVCSCCIPSGKEHANWPSSGLASSQLNSYCPRLLLSVSWWLTAFQSGTLCPRSGYFLSFLVYLHISHKLEWGCVIVLPRSRHCGYVCLSFFTFGWLFPVTSGAFLGAITIVSLLFRLSHEPFSPPHIPLILPLITHCLLCCPPRADKWIQRRSGPHIMTHSPTPTQMHQRIPPHWIFVDTISEQKLYQQQILCS